MTDKQYKTARKAIESDLEQAKRLGCTITCKKLSWFLEINYKMRTI